MTGEVDPGTPAPRSPKWRHGAGLGRNTMSKYWVVGGKYASTDFSNLAPGAEDVRIGPFVSYAEARSAWAELSRQASEQCNVRFVITESG